MSNIVEFPGPDGTTLHGYLHIPEGGGHFPVMICNHGSERPVTDHIALPHFFNNHNYVFFKPVRRGHGISSSFEGTEYEYIEDLADQYKNDPHHSTEDIRKYYVSLHEKYNEDVKKAVHWIKSDKPFIEHGVKIDTNRIAMMGVSYGGIQTILSAEKDWGLQACLPFAPAAESWGNTDLRARLLTAVQHASVPMFLIQAENDFSTGPYTELGLLIKLKGGLNRAKLYGVYGDKNEPKDGHSLGATAGGVAIWQYDVLKFLSAALSNAVD